MTWLQSYTVLKNRRLLYNLLLKSCFSFCLYEYFYLNVYYSTRRRCLPVDHLVSVLEGLTTLCHFCLLDSVAPVSVGLQTPSLNTVTMETSSAGQILNNLINVFNPSTNSRVRSLYMYIRVKSHH